MFHATSKQKLPQTLGRAAKLSQSFCAGVICAGVLAMSCSVPMRGNEFLAGKSSVNDVFKAAASAEIHHDYEGAKRLYAKALTLRPTPNEVCEIDAHVASMMITHGDVKPGLERARAAYAKAIQLTKMRQLNDDTMTSLLVLADAAQAARFNASVNDAMQLAKLDIQLRDALEPKFAGYERALAYSVLGSLAAQAGDLSTARQSAKQVLLFKGTDRYDEIMHEQLQLCDLILRQKQKDPKASIELRSQIASLNKRLSKRDVDVLLASSYLWCGDVSLADKMYKPHVNEAAYTMTFKVEQLMCEQLAKFRMQQSPKDAELYARKYIKLAHASGSRVSRGVRLLKESLVLQNRAKEAEAVSAAATHQQQQTGSREYNWLIEEEKTSAAKRRP